MKRFWLILLSLGLITAFSTQASAVDVKFSGDFYVAGMYLDKTTFRSTDEYWYSGTAKDEVKHLNAVGPSTGFFYQRLRLRTDFVVSPGLSFITRADIMERVWGGKRSTATAAIQSDQSAQSAHESENIAFDWAYISYDSPIGTFRVGYMNDSAWGTVFMDTAMPRGKVAWSNTTGPWYYTLQIVKQDDNSSSAVAGSTYTDNDRDKYVAAAKYTWSSGEAGLLAGVGRDARPKPSGYTSLFYILQPYAIAQFGPVKVQAEIDYFWGTWKDYETGVLADQKLENLGVFIDAVADFGIVYAGGTFAYISGDDPTTDKMEGNSLLVNGGRDWNPCLILFNSDLSYWAGAIPGYSTTQNPSLNNPAIPPGSTADGMTNAWFGQGRVGVRPTPKLDIMASVSYATADQRPAGVINREYGWEADLTGTYKITNNLSYMIGGGYLWTGDYYQGTSQEQGLNNNYLLINKLTLTF